MLPSGYGSYDRVRRAVEPRQRAGAFRSRLYTVKASVDRTQQLREIQEQLPVIVGEWSLCLRGKALEGIDTLKLDAARRAYAAAQLLSYDQARGWFFWTYKTETRLEWSLRESVEGGWMPEKYRTV